MYLVQLCSNLKLYHICLNMMLFERRGGGALERWNLRLVPLNLPRNLLLAPGNLLPEPL